MSQSKISSLELQAIVQNLKARAPKATFNVEGKVYDVSEIVSLAEDILSARTAVSTAVGAANTARSTRDQVEGDNTPTLEEIRGMLVSMFKNDASAMADVGVAPRRTPRRLTTEERAAANAKNVATRQSRGTLGKRQKAKVKGNVTGVVVTPVVSPAPATAPSVSPTTGAVVNPAFPGAPTLPNATANLAVSNGAPGTPGH